MLAEDGVACHKPGLTRSFAITFSISRPAVLAISALFASNAHDEGVSDFMFIGRYSPKTRSVRTRPSGPSISLMALKDSSRTTPSSEVG